MRKVYLFGLVGFIICFWGLTQVFADNLCVNTTGAHGCYTTIQDAVDNANAGDVIWVEPGVYYENVHVTTANLTIQGGTYARKRSLFGGANGATGWTLANPEQVVIDARPDEGCACTGPGVWIDGEGVLAGQNDGYGAENVTLRNLTVRHACAPEEPPYIGDNIYSTANGTTLDTVHSISSDYGGVYIEGDYATVQNCYFAANFGAVGIAGDYATVQDNTMYNHHYAGVYIEGDDPLVTRNTIDGIDAVGEESAAIHIGYGDNAVVTYNTIKGVYGPGIIIDEGNSCMVFHNEITSTCLGGIWLWGSNDCTVNQNTISLCQYGIVVEGNEGEEGGNTISNNTLEGGIYGIIVIENNPTVTGNTVDNYAEGIHIDCPDTCIGGTISNNQVERATIMDTGFSLMVDNMTISNNVAEHNPGGGFYISGDNNTIQNNSARYNGGKGIGGFYITGDGNAISNNLAELNWNYGFYIYGNNTVTNNTARNNYRTGICLDGPEGVDLTVDANIVTNNHGEGIANNALGGGTTVSITNNIATGNRTDICNNGTIDVFTGNTYNTGGDTTPCCLEGAGGE